jgi:hypothetical protein
MVMPRLHPIRSAITVAGMLGQSRSSARICGSNSSTAEGFCARSYLGGASERIAVLTVFLATPNCRAIALVPICSAKASRRISAQSSTDNTHPSS